MLNELFQTKVNMMESLMKDLNTRNPLSQIELPPPTNHYTLFWLHMSVRAPSNSSSTFIPISEISLTISVDPFRSKTWIEWLEYICISIFLLVKIFLKLHIADHCCCGVNLVSPVRPLQAEICSRHEFWWWQVVAASGGGGGVVQYRTTEAAPTSQSQPWDQARGNHWLN